MCLEFRRFFYLLEFDINPHVTEPLPPSVYKYVCFSDSANLVVLITKKGKVVQYAKVIYSALGERNREVAFFSFAYLIM